MDTGNALQEFKDTIERIMDDLETVMYLLDHRENPGVTISGKIHLYKSLSSELDEAFQKLEEAEGDTLLKDIDPDFKFRD